MKLLVDEDLASKDLLSRLEAILGADVVRPQRGVSDQDVWDRAQSERAAVLTGNTVDFLRLAASLPHHGLLLVYRTNDRSSDLRAPDIAAAVIAIRSAYPDGVESVVLAVNSFVREPL